MLPRREVVQLQHLATTPRPVKRVILPCQVGYYDSNIEVSSIVVKEVKKIRRAIGPVACEITSSRVVFVDPPYLPEEPRDPQIAPSEASRGWAEPLGKVFLAIEKII